MEGRDGRWFYRHQGAALLGAIGSEVVACSRTYLLANLGTGLELGDGRRRWGANVVMGRAKITWRAQSLLWFLTQSYFGFGWRSSSGERVLHLLIVLNIKSGAFIWIWLRDYGCFDPSKLKTVPNFRQITGRLIFWYIQFCFEIKWVLVNWTTFGNAMQPITPRYCSV